MSSPRVWFITGSSTGFGRYLTELALQKGDKVVATLRKPAVLDDLKTQYSTDQLLVLRLDVSILEDVTSGFAKAVETFGRIDIVVNNAGWGIVSEIEATPDDLARSMFEVMFWGARSVSVEAIKVFRDVNKPAGGKLLQMSSMFGIDASPGAGYYCAAKFAFEGLSESLWKELDPSWNIQVSLLCPGWFKTPMVQSNAKHPEPLPAYSDPSMPSMMVRAAFKAFEGGDHPALQDPVKLVKAIYEISKLDTLPTRIPLGQDAIAIFKTKIDTYTADIEKTAQWSKDLRFD